MLASSSVKNLLNEIAYNTATDPSLAVLVSVRPHCARAITNQALYTALLVSQLKAACFAAGVTSRKSGGATAAAAVSVLTPSTAIATPLQVQITVIGCGSIGSMIVEALLSSASVHPTSLSVVTRQPEQLGHFVARGVRCYKTVDDVIDTADLFIIACQPGQLSAVAKAMKGRIQPRTLCLSICCGVPVEKVCAELGHVNCVASSVDVDSLTRCVANWTKEDDAVARYQRAAYAASKTFAEVKDTMTNEERRIIEMTPQERRAVRIEQVLEQSFPASMSTFFNRLCFTLVLSCMHRGIDASRSAQLVWTALLADEVLPMPITAPPPLPKMSKRQLDEQLVEYCNFSACAEHLQVDPRQLFVASKERFHQLLRPAQQLV